MPGYMTLGILAHVDAGKTTLSESLLLQAGVIRNAGRVDHKDTFLDTDATEKDRGITIYSKQARLPMTRGEVVLLDTPGHVDFSAETERTVPVLDSAILVISASDGVQSHTKTLWKLLRRYHVPVFTFVNKMDQPGADRARLLKDLKEVLSDSFVDFTDILNSDADGFNELLENIAVHDENIMNTYLETGNVEKNDIKNLIKFRKIFPVFFGSALKDQGVKEFYDTLDEYLIYYDERNKSNISQADENPKDRLTNSIASNVNETSSESGKDSADSMLGFSGKIYKIGRDEHNTRLTYIKITEGSLKVRTLIGDEKVNQIRRYSGIKYEQTSEAFAGEIVAVTGLNSTYAGQGLGNEKANYMPELEPVLNYRIILPEGVDPVKMYPLFQEIEEEEPLLQLSYQPEKGGIIVRIMGEIQCDILKGIIKDRFDMDIDFASEGIVYKETILEPVEGVGHFEPLRHYAEVHVLIEPGIPGSGVTVESNVSVDMLDKNWQRLIMANLRRKRHKGVLIGAELTDVVITVVGGQASKKHTEGGDFREATIRAVRQGLMMGKCQLLEPVYSFEIRVPDAQIGRVMTDITEMGGDMLAPEQEDGYSILHGEVAVSHFAGYQRQVASFTGGEGSVSVTLAGYGPCKDQEKIVEASHYDPELDQSNPTGSVFCQHGAGYYVPWNQVRQFMHVDSGIYFEGETAREQVIKTQGGSVNLTLSEEELEEIFNRTFNANKNNKKDDVKRRKRPLGESVSKNTSYKRPVFKDKYLLVDGYNVIHAWDELRELINDNLHGARIKLQDMLCNYQAYKRVNLILVFDAYKVPGGVEHIQNYNNIHVVYTKEKQTADAYIESFTHEHSKHYDITVATSDGLEQMIVIGDGAKRMSSRDLHDEIIAMEKDLREHYLNREF